MLKKIIQKFTSTQEPQVFYIILGQETGVYELVKNFYNIMESDPKAYECLHTHELTNDLIPDEVKKKLFMFLCGWVGGPNLFQEAYGHPRMRARHMHIKIGSKERSQWLYCMQKAIKMHSVSMTSSQKKILINSFKALGMRIQNQPK
jgi:hemoglobin